MHTVYIHIDEELNDKQVNSVSAELRRIRHVTDVEFDAGRHHDVLVEYTPHRGMPLPILRMLSSLGFHADVVSC